MNELGVRFPLDATNTMEGGTQVDHIMSPQGTQKTATDLVTKDEQVNNSVQGSDLCNATQVRGHNATQVRGHNATWGGGGGGCNAGQRN